MSHSPVASKSTMNCGSAEKKDQSADDPEEAALRRAEAKSPWFNRPTPEDVDDFTINDLDNEYALWTLLMSDDQTIKRWLRRNGLLIHTQVRSPSPSNHIVTISVT